MIEVGDRRGREGEGEWGCGKRRRKCVYETYVGSDITSSTTLMTNVFFYGEERHILIFTRKNIEMWLLFFIFFILMFPPFFHEIRREDVCACTWSKKGCSRMTVIKREEFCVGGWSGYLPLLAQLTEVGCITEQEFTGELKSASLCYHIRGVWRNTSILPSTHCACGQGDFRNRGRLPETIMFLDVWLDSFSLGTSPLYPLFFFLVSIFIFLFFCFLVDIFGGFFFFFGFFFLKKNQIYL